MTSFYTSSAAIPIRYFLLGIVVLILGLPAVSQAQKNGLSNLGQSQASNLPPVSQPQISAYQALSDRYIVVYKQTSTAQARVMGIASFQQRQQLMRLEATATLLRAKLSGKSILHVYDTALKGFAVSGLTGADVNQLRQDDQVAYVVPDLPVYMSESGAPTLLAANCNGPSITLNGVTNYAVGVATFGSTTAVSGQVVLVDDGSAPATDGCSTIQNNVAGKIALIDRGICSFVVKAGYAQQAGAIGVIIVNNTVGDAPALAGTATNITIPVMSLSQTDGNALKTALASGPVTAILDRQIPDNSSQCKPWGISRVGGGASGVGKRAWIIDSGIDLTHPDLTVNTALSTYFVGSSPADENGHGTHVAGTVAAKDNGFGVIGVAAGAEVVAVRVFGAENTGSTANIIAGVNYVASYASSGDVVNMSLGGPPNPALDAAVVALSGVCKVVVAAGNDSKNANYTSPGRVNGPNVLTVSAMNISDQRASFSNFGNGPVDYSAPGVNIASCWLNGGYAYDNGTSMAAPHVAGLLLLGTICATSKITGDVDGTPDPIATLYNPATDVDNDQDGVTVCGGDCDDNDASVHPGATEICDGKDNNCDGQIDEGNVCCPAGNLGTLYVNASATGTNNGLTWANAFTSLQSALTAAKRCTQITQIWVAKGTYYPSTDVFGQTAPADARTKTFVMQNNLAIYGGFAGNEPAGYNLALRNLNTNATTLSGDIQQDNSIANNAYHVILNFPAYGSSLNNTAVLDGFIVRDGSATFLATTSAGNVVSLPDSYGGGIYTYGSSPTIKNSILFNNQAYYGGGMENMIASPSLMNCFIVGNASGNSGGGILNEISASPTLTNCAIQKNSAPYGAGIGNNNSSSPALTNCSFSGNSASTAGGSMYNYDGSSPVVKNSVLWGNSSEVSNAAASSTVAASNPTFTYSIIQGGWSGAGSNNQNINPQFVSQPVIGQSGLGDLSLLAYSPAINAGDPATSPATVGLTDLAGYSRFFNGGRIDIGAYEFQGNPVLLLTTAATPNPAAVGTTVALSVTATGGSMPYSYTWTAPAGITLSATSTSAVSASIGAGVSGVQTLTVTVAASGGSPTSTSLVSLTTVAPDLTPIVYASPTTINGTAAYSMVVDIVNVNNAASTGLITVVVTKDALLTLGLDASLTTVGGRSVQNSLWTLSMSNPGYYTLTTSQPVAAGNKISFGLNGTFSAGATKGIFTNSATLLGGSGGEARFTNNTDADKVDYFPQ